jgi:lipoate-protein ligase A
LFEKLTKIIRFNLVEFYWLYSNWTDPALNLALEESLLDGPSMLPEDSSIVLFYVNRESVVIGKNQNPWLEVSWDVLHKQAPPLYRRITGGGAVYHDMGNLNFSFIQPRSRFSKEQNLELIVQAASSLGVTLVRTERGDLLLGESTLVESRKVSGNALCYRKNRVLHHGTLLVHANLEELKRSLTTLPEMKSRFRCRSVGSIPSSTANIGDVVTGLTLNTLVEKIREEVQSSWGPMVHIENPDAVIESSKFQERVRRHRSWEWVYGATPSFQFCLPEEEVEITVEKGRILYSTTETGDTKLFEGRVFDPTFSYDLNLSIKRRDA